MGLRGVTHNWITQHAQCDSVMVVWSEKKVLLVQIKKWKKAQKVHKYVQSLIWCSWRRWGTVSLWSLWGEKVLDFLREDIASRSCLAFVETIDHFLTLLCRTDVATCLTIPLGMSYKLWKMCSLFIFWVRWKCWVTHFKDQINRVMECAERLIPSDVWLLPPDLSAKRLFSWAPPASRVCVWLQQAHSLHR